MSLPEELDVTLGAERYATFEDRGLCLLRTERGVDAALIEARLQAVVDELHDSARAAG